jgi:hypothetical protein
MRRFTSKLPVVVGIAVAFSLMAMLVPHADDLPLSGETPGFLNIVMDNTDCATNAGVGNEDCTQTIRQIRSLMAAMVTAICTIAAVASNGRWTVIYGCIAGLTALKAVFNQFMYITNGDLTLPILIIATAALITWAASIGAFFGSR